MENLIKAMTYDYPDEIPILSAALPAAWIKYGEEMNKLSAEYPEFLPRIDINNIQSIIPGTYHMGDFTDEWGCVWSNIDEGMESIVTKHPVPNREDIRSLEIPDCKEGRLPHGFMYLRLLDLRGFDEAMYDFADECEELQMLIDKVLEYNCKQIEILLPRTGKVFMCGDDQGTQKGIAIGAQRWRKYLKPCYKKLYSMVRASGKLVYMHTDGDIIEIMPDLVECGVNMINPQFRANGLENLIKTCKGKIPICLDLDRQMFPFATPSEIESHVRECVEALYMPEGGLALNVEVNYEVPLNNMAAIYDALRKYKKYKK